MINKIFQAIESKAECDIVIIGKGPSIDSVDLSLIKDCIIINVNDSELVYPGDIAVFHHEWVTEVINNEKPKCKLYVTDQEISKDVNRLNAEYVPNNPQSADFMIHRFFSKKLYIEDSMIVSALRIANEIAIIAGNKKNAYLLGFDFTRKDGFTSKISSAYDHNDPDFQERKISSQEQLLERLLSERENLSINIKHIGIKKYSLYSVNSFNRVFFRHRHGLPIENVHKTNVKKIPTKGKVKIVAEITTNHFGDMERLEAMVVYAKQAGADFVKFQKRDVESFYSVEQLDALYKSPFGNTFRDYRQGIELNRDAFLYIDDLCNKIDIEWFASVLDMPSYEFMLEFNPKIIKLPSTISEHKDFLKKVAKKHTGDIVISMGYTNKEFEEFIISNFTNVKKLYLLQCTSSYPAPDKDTQIGVVRHYYNLSKSNSKIIPGFSSHDVGSLCSMMAIAAGAAMIEKHVKFGHVSWSHFDEVAVNLENGEFDKFVSDIRRSEEIVGGEDKIIHASEHHKYWVKS